MTYHIGGQGLDHIITEDVPPQLDQILGMGIVRRYAGGLCLRVELNQPWLQFAGEMQNLNLISEPVMQYYLRIRALPSKLVIWEVIGTYCLKAGR